MEINNSTKVVAGLLITAAALVIAGAVGHKWEVIVSGCGLGAISSIGSIWYSLIVDKEEPVQKEMDLHRTHWTHTHTKSGISIISTFDRATGRLQLRCHLC